jgi:steroid delta-isomerase
MSELPGPDSKHPARLAAWRSADAVARGDRQAWLDNFADDAVVEDPVGPSYLDPEGSGHRGKEAIGKFWDAYIANARPMFSLVSSYACGNECANVGSLSTQMENGAVGIINGVFVYRVDEAGRVAALRTYWEVENMKLYPPFADRGKS